MLLATSTVTKRAERGEYDHGFHLISSAARLATTVATTQRGAAILSYPPPDIHV